MIDMSSLEQQKHVLKIVSPQKSDLTVRRKRNSLCFWRGSNRAVVPHDEHDRKMSMPTIKHLLSHAYMGKSHRSGRDQSHHGTVDERDIDPKGWDRLVISQTNGYKASFDVLVGLCVLFSAISVPLELAYQV